MIYRHLTIFVFTSLLLSGCAQFGSPKADPWVPGTAVPLGHGVVLVAVTGPSAVNYMQYCRGNGGCLNYRFPPVANDVIALPVPIPSIDVGMDSITLANRAAGVAPTGGGGSVEYGYIAIRDEPVFSVTDATVRFHITINTAQGGGYSSAANPAAIKRAAEKYGPSLTSMKPENFTW